MNLLVPPPALGGVWRHWRLLPSALVKMVRLRQKPARPQDGLSEGDLRLEAAAHSGLRTGALLAAMPRKGVQGKTVGRKPPPP